MRPFILAALLIAPLAAQAQQPPDMVLLPRQTVEMALQWISVPDPTTAVRIYANLQACLADNPENGRLARVGKDLCTAVTEALAARTKELADAKAAAPKAAATPSISGGAAAPEGPKP